MKKKINTGIQMNPSKKSLTYIIIGLMFIALTVTITVAQENSPCDSYMERAEGKTEFPYPDYFGAGEEYLLAAGCYEREGDQEKAEEAYAEAAQKFKTASQNLVQGGDYRQAAESYEKAATAYESLGEIQKAIETYQLSLSRYRDGGLAEEAQRIQGIIDDLEEENGVLPTEEINYTAIIGLISLIALFLSLSLLILIAMANASSTEEESEEKEEPKGLGEPKTTKKETTETPEKKTKKKSPRQRAIEKLRKKYKP